MAAIGQEQVVLVLERKPHRVDQLEESRFAVRLSAFFRTGSLPHRILARVVEISLQNTRLPDLVERGCVWGTLSSDTNTPLAVSAMQKA